MTIKEIAKLSGVGVSTVSRYLNDGYVSEEKREIIARVIEEHNYSPNSAAVKMRGGSNEIVVIVQRISSNSTSRFLEGIIETCRTENLSPTIITTNFDKQYQQKVIEEAIGRNVLGVVVFSFTPNIGVKANNIIVVGQNANNNTSIYSNGKSVYFEMVTNIVTHNQVKKINVLGLDLLDEEFVNRVIGTKQAAESKSLEVDISEVDFSKAELNMNLEQGTYYVCMTDAHAYAVMKLANDQQFRIGEDVYISGYGNYSTSQLLGLTTVDGQYEEIGKLAINKVKMRDTNNIEFNPTIIYRQSSNE